MSAHGAIPTMRCRDARKQIDWLGKAFGFEPHLVVDGEDGAVAHAQLTLGKAMIMLGEARDDEFGALQQPADAGQSVAQSAYLIVDDPDALHDRAKAAGADIVIAPHSPEYGGRFFICRDPEGQIWNFGSYNPWEDEA